MLAEMRALGLSVISILLTSAVIGNAYYQKKQFYPSVVYITKSNPSMAVSIILITLFLLCLLFLNTVSVLILFTKGHLRSIAGRSINDGQTNEKGKLLCKPKYFR